MRTLVAGGRFFRHTVAGRRDRLTPEHIDTIEENHGQAFC